MNRSRFFLPDSLRWVADLIPSVLAIVLFAGAGIAFIQSGGALLNLAQPLAGFLISFVIIATVCWEWKLLGNPSKPGPLVAHLMMFVAVFFMVNALYSQGEDTRSLLGRTVDGFAWLSGAIAGVPDVVFDVIRSPSVALLFLGICLALAVPRRIWAVGLLVGISGLAIAWGLSKGVIMYPGWFGCGMVLLGAGIMVMKRNFRLETFWNEVRKRLTGDEAVRGDLELKIRLLRKLEKEGRPLDPEECAGCVARAVALDETDPAVREATGRIARQMVFQDGLAELDESGGKLSLALNPALFVAEDGDDVWTAIARVPKVVIVLLIATLWVLSPVDLIPDATPIIGVVDDVAVALLGFSMIRRRVSAPENDSRRLP